LRRRAFGFGPAGAAFGFSLPVGTSTAQPGPKIDETRNTISPAVPSALARTLRPGIV